MNNNTDKQKKSNNNKLIAFVVSALVIAGLVSYAVVNKIDIKIITSNTDGRSDRVAINKETAAFLRHVRLPENRPSEELLRDHGRVELGALSPRKTDIVPSATPHSTEQQQEAVDTKEVALDQSSVMPPQPLGAYHIVSVTPPILKEVASGWKASSSMPLSEVIEKRQKIARGERLYKRVIVRRPDALVRPTTIEDVSKAIN